MCQPTFFNFLIFIVVHMNSGKICILELADELNIPDNTKYHSGICITTDLVLRNGNLDLYDALLCPIYLELT